MPISFEWYVLGLKCLLWQVFSMGTNRFDLLTLSHEIFFWQDLSMDANRFDLVTLTMVFDQHSENFNNTYDIISMVYTRTLIFHIKVCCNKSFPWVPTGLTMLPWPVCFTYWLKTLTLAVSFEWYLLGLWYFTCQCSLTQDLPMSTNRYDIVTLTLVFGLHIEIFNFRVYFLNSMY
jgi:hypothetical protein